MFKDLSVIVLAAGRGTRMESNRPKVLSLLLGKPLIGWTMDLINSLGIKDVVMVVGFKANMVKEYLSANKYKAVLVEDKKVLGTAYSTKIGLGKISRYAKNVLVLYGDDSALYNKESIQRLIYFHYKNKSKITLMSLKSNKLEKLGGIIVDKNNKVTDVLSYEEHLQMGLTHTCILCGALMFDRDWLINNIKKIKKGKIRGEYPLPQLIFIANENNVPVNVVFLRDKNEWNSVNTPEELLEAEHKKEYNINKA